MPEIIVVLFLIGSVLLFPVIAHIFINSLQKIGEFLEWKEFVLGFLLIALASSIPNFFVALFSILLGTPQLSFGDVLGGNLFDLTVAIGCPAIIAKSLRTQKAIIRDSSLFVVVAVLLPLLLALDGRLSRIDGVLLLLSGIGFLTWLVRNRKEIEKGKTLRAEFTFGEFLRNIFYLGFSFVMTAILGFVVVESAKNFSQRFEVSLALLGYFLVGVANAFPEFYFALLSARRSSVLALADIIGSIVLPATIFLGLLGLFSPFEIINSLQFNLIAVFLIVSSLVFWWFGKTGKEISRKEGFILVLLYLIFIFLATLFS